MIDWIKQYSGQLMLLMVAGALSTGVATVITASDNKREVAAIKTAAIPAIKTNAAELETRVRKIEIQNATMSTNVDWIRKYLETQSKAKK